MRHWTWICQALATVIAVGLAVENNGARGEEEPTAPRPIPLTRPEMKLLLEEMKARTPRIPLPELTAEEQAALGEREAGYESRLRALYLPAGDSRGGFAIGGGPPPGIRGREGGTSGVTRGPLGRDNDPAMSLDFRFKTSLFWIVSRANNCQYCLGHQESKLLSAGMTEDQIAALDSQWGAFSPAEQAAFALARRVTLEPHLLSEADIARAREYYSDLQVLEMILSVAGNNALNRWKEGTGVPQSSGGGGFGRREEGTAAEPHSYLTPTSPEFATALSRVAPIVVAADGQPTNQTVCRRPPLESPEEVERGLEAARQRTPRLPLVEEGPAREVLAELAPSGPLPQWMRLLANFPVTGKRNVAGVRAADDLGDLPPLLKAQVSWIIARQDRAWYATGQARQRLRELGQSDEQIFALDGDWADFTPTQRALFTVARQLAASPVVLTDAEVAAALKLAGPRQVVQLISYTTHRASFDRITEAAGLRLEK